MSRPLSRRWLGAWLCGTCLAGVAAPAVALPPTVPTAQLALQSWGRREGLPTASINDIAVDGDGLLWFGTDLGLVSFDGVAATRYNALDTPTLPADAVTGLRWVDGWLWIATPRGLCRWRDGAFSAIGPELGVPNDRRTGLSSTGPLVVMVDTDSFLWRDGRFVALGVPAASDAAQEADGDIVFAGDPVRRWHDGVVSALPELGGGDRALADGADSGWLAIKDRGVVRFAGAREATVIPLTDNIKSLLLDREGALWIGSAGLGARRRTADGAIERIPGLEGCVNAMIELADGSMVLASCSGFTRLREARFRVFDARSGLPNDPLSVFEDRGGTLWIASASDPALLAWRDGKARRYALPEPALTHLESGAGTHWVGTPQGLYKIDGDAAVPVPLPLADSPGEATVAALPTITALAENDGALWIATLDKGLLRLRDGVVTRVGGSPRCTALAVDGARHALWVGTMGGVFRVDATDGAPSVVEIADGPFGSAYAIAVRVERDGTVWAGSYENGLLRLRDGKQATLTRREGLPFDTVYAMLEDAHGDLWMPGPSGIARASRAALDAVADGRAERVAGLRTYGSGDGMPLDETTGGSMNASRAPDGRLWFATPGGVVGVDPRVPDRVPESPRAVIGALSVGATRLPRAGGAVPAEDRDLTVQFSAPTLERAGEVRFRYRLDDVDADWVDAGTRRIAMYTDLPPGPHHFRVAAIAPHAPDYGPEATFDLELAARFTETVAFKVLMVALAGLVLFAVYRLRTAQLRARERTLARLVDTRTGELSAARSELLELNADLERRVDEAVEELRQSERMAAYGKTVAGVAHEVRQPLVALGTTAFVLGQKLRAEPRVQREVDLIARETRRMNRVMDELLDFAKPRTLALAPTPVAALVADSIAVFRDEHDREQAVRIDVDVPPELVARADAARVEHVLVNLLANAHKHAQDLSRIHVTAARVGDAIALDVADDGRGIPEDVRAPVFEPFVTTGGTGLGLAIARQIAAEHGGTLTLVEGARGSTFRLTLPASEA